MNAGKSPLAPFAVRNFRYQWGSDLPASLAIEMETLILGWYVLVETRSVVLLTVFGSLQFLGSLLAPFTGVIGDRLGSRILLLAIRATYAVLAILLMVLGMTGTLTPVLVFAIALLAGLLRPTEYMMRLALVGEIIPAERLMGAMSLSRITIDVARIAGALTGAGLFASLGLPASYVVISGLYLVSVGLTLRIAMPAAVARRVSMGLASGWRELTAGMAHVWNTPSVLAIMWLAFLVNLTAFPVTLGLLPYVAKEIYGVNEIGLGHLVASHSVGSLAGSIMMTFWGGMSNAMRAMLATTVLWYVGTMVFAFVETKWTGIAVLFTVGLFQCVAMVTSLTALLQTTREQYRARVMGVRMLAVYGLPLGLVASGYLIDVFGFVATVNAYSVVGLATTVFIGHRWRHALWR